MAIASADPLSPHTLAHAPIIPRSVSAFQRQESRAYIILGLVSIVSAIAFGAMAYVGRGGP